MSDFGSFLYLIVIIVAISGFMKAFERSKKATLIMTAMSPIFLLISYFISPYLNWRGKFDGMFDFAKIFVTSDQNAVMLRYVILFILFWMIFFALSTLTFKFVIKKMKACKNKK